MLCELLVGLLTPTIWIVDAASGPGTNFTDLPQAIAAAQDGDTILVRAGAYSAVTITGKALVIRGAGTANTVVQAITVGSLPAPGLILAGIRFEPGLSGNLVVVDFSGPGRTVLLDCQAIGASGSWSGLGALQVGGGATVHAARCWFEGGSFSSSYGSLSAAGTAATVSGASRLVATACTFRGGSAYVSTTVSYPVVAGGGVNVSGSEVELAGSDCFGGSAPGAYNYGWARAAVEVNPGAAVRISGPATLRGGVGNHPTSGPVGAPAVAASNGSTTVVYGGVTLVPALPGAPLLSGPVTMSPVTMPRLTVQTSTLANGETNALTPLTMTFNAQLPNAPYAFVVGLQPDFASPFGSLVLGPLLVDLTSAGLATGTLDVQGRFSFSLVPINVFGGALGIPFFSQAAAFDGATLQFRASNVDERIFAL